VIERALVGETMTSKALVIPYTFLVVLAVLYIFLV
jgi:hypothetical protein